MPRSPRPATAAAAVATALALSCAAALSLTAAPRAAFAQAPAPAAVRYAPEGDRQIIFVNNPERLELNYTDLIPGSKDYGVVFNDLADPGLGGKSILEITVDQGKYRNYFEHVWNFTRKTEPAVVRNPIAYAVRVYNPNQTDIAVTVRGKGFINNSNGGQSLAELLNSKAVSDPVVVPPGEAVFVFRSDVDYAGTSRATVPTGNFFSGAVDFDIEGGRAIVTNLAYQNFSDVYFRPTLILPPPFGDFTDLSGPQYMGFVTRRYAAATTPAPEVRTYKGLMVYPNIDSAGVAGGGNVKAGGQVGAQLSYIIDDTTPARDMPVTHARYLNDSNGSLNRFSPSATAVSANSWWTGNVPSRDTATIQVVASDMFDIVTPGYGTLYSLFSTTAPNTQAGQFNVGNWGVIYHDAIKITNNGARDRTFALKLNNNTGGGSPIAYRRADGTWLSQNVGSAPFTYHTFTVPAGQTVTSDGYFVIGAPAVTTLKHTLTLTN